MNQNSRDQLLQLIEDLRLPMTPEDAEEKLSHMNDKQVQLLLESYQEAKNYLDDVEAMAEEADPEAFTQTETEYKVEVTKLDDEYDHEEEKLQTNLDHELDKLDLDTKHKLSDTLHKQQMENNEIEDEFKDLYGKMASVLIKYAATSEQDGTQGQKKAKEAPTAE